MKRRSDETILALINQAVALENAGMRWRVKHVAAMTGYSESHIRNSACPKHTEPPGPRARHGKPTIVFLPKEVREWHSGLLDQQQEPRVRTSSHPKCPICNRPSYPGQLGCSAEHQALIQSHEPRVRIPA